MARLNGLVAFVTGASSGIGAALANELARRGADVALAARRVERLDEVAAAVRSTGRRAAVIGCDVTRDGDLDNAVRETVSNLGRIDIAIANAGFGVVGRVETLTLDDYRRQFETNVYGVLRTVHATLPELKRTRGRLAIIGSVLGHVTSPGNSPYCMSKFAVRSLAAALRVELATAGVSVTHICPGYVKSEIHQIDNLGRRDPGAVHKAEWLRMPAERAARQIISAIAARRRERVITGHGKMLVFVEHHFPWLIAGAMRMSAMRAARRRSGDGSNR